MNDFVKFNRPDLEKLASGCVEVGSHIQRIGSKYSDTIDDAGGGNAGFKAPAAAQKFQAMVLMETETNIGKPYEDFGRDLQKVIDRITDLDDRLEDLFEDGKERVKEIFGEGKERIRDLFD